MSDVILIDNSIDQGSILVPVSTVQADFVTETGTIVYVPLASTHSPGIVTIGEGLLISPDGLLEFDRTEVTLKSLALNGKLLEPDENKHINLVLTKNDVGLDKVDNTADEDKPVSNATKAALNELDKKLTLNISNVNDDLVAHVNRVDNPHKVAKEQIGLGNVDNTSDINKPISRATKNELARIERLIKGAANIFSYDSYEALVEDVNPLDDSVFKVGQSVYIRTLNVPDLWVFSIEEEPVEFEYTTDADIENLLKTEGLFQVGYFKFAALETGKVNLDSYVTLDTAQTITGDKNYTGLLKLNDKPVAIQEDVDYIAENYLPLTAGNKKHVTGKLYVDGDIVLPNNVHYRSVTSDGKEITLFGLAGSNAIMIGDSSGNYDMATYSLFRPVTGATKAALGSTQYKWNSIHGVEIYQNDKQVANKEDLDGYLPLSAGSDKCLTGPLYVKSSDVSVWSGSTGIIFDSGASIGSLNTGTLGIKAKGSFYVRIGDTTEVNIDASSVRPSSKGGSSLGTSSYQWLNLYAQNIYQNDKPVANAEDLSAVTDATLSDDNKTLTITKRNGTSFDFQGGGGGVPKATCSTSSGTDTKVVDLDGFVVEKGATIDVTFTYSNGSGLPKLNVNSTGAKSIQYYTIGANRNTTLLTRAGGGDTSIPFGGWRAGDTVRFFYDGTYWIEVMNISAGAQYAIPYRASSADSADSASTSTTRATTDNSTNIATTAFVKSVLPNVTDVTLSSDSKTLTVTKRDGTSFNFQGGSSDLSNYVTINTEQTITAAKRFNARVTVDDHNTDTAISVIGSASGAYINYLNTSGTVLGYLGCNSSKRASFYNGTYYTLAYTTEIPKLGTTNWTVSQDSSGSLVFTYA